MWTALWHDSVPLIQWATVLGASLAAAGWDIRCRRIPNFLTGPVLLAGLIWAAASAGWAGLGDSLAAAALLGLPYVVLFLQCGGGAGDAKLMMALGAWLGLVNGVVVLT